MRILFAILLTSVVTTTSAQSVFVCDPACGEGQRCESGSCTAGEATPPESDVPATCIPSCRGGYTCDSGTCVAQPRATPRDACVPTCRLGFTCQSGGCVAQPSDIPAQTEPPTSSSEPTSRRLDRKIRLSVLGIVRVGGGYIINDSGGESGATNDMDPGFGGAIRLEFPLGSHATLGPMFQFVSLKDDGVEDRYDLVAPSVWISSRHVFEFGHGGIEIYLGVPIGFTALIYHEDEGNEVDRGFHYGLLGGLRFLFGATIGLMVEAGFMRDHIVAPDNGREKYTQIQASVNAGLSFGF